MLKVGPGLHTQRILSSQFPKGPRENLSSHTDMLGTMNEKGDGNNLKIFKESVFSLSQKRHHYAAHSGNRDSNTSDVLATEEVCWVKRVGTRTRLSRDF